MKSKISSLYIHIPFCRKICSYCDFAKLIYNEKMVDDYMSSLYADLKSINQKKFKTIYIGGGTPSCLPLFHLNNLLGKLSTRLTKKYEFCIEVNVEDINHDLLKCLKRYNINRISIGIQTFNDKYIKLSNRGHTALMVEEKIKLAKQYFDNISVDMIYGFYNQSIDELKDDINKVILLDVSHISYYSLLIEPNTILYNKHYSNMDDILQAKMYKIIYQSLKKHGYKRYEISNFSKQGYQSKHNLVYWHNQHYYGIGLNASGYIDNIRYKNTRNFSNYISGKNNKEREELSFKDIKFDYIMLHLRLDKGLNLKDYQKKFNSDFLQEYKETIKSLKDKKLLLINDKRVKASFKGSLLLNQILEEFLD